MSSSVVVIGGGISGLTALYELKKNGIDATLFERDDRAGGRIKTIYVDGVPVEVGAGYFHKYYYGFMHLARELGIWDSVSPTHKSVRMIKDGEMVDFSPIKFVFSRQLGIRDKVSAANLFRDVKQYARAGQGCLEKFDREDTLNFLDIVETDPELQDGYRTNFDEYIRGRVSATIADYFIGPFCRMTLFDSPETLNKACGMAVLIPSTTGLLGFENGMETVIKALYGALSDFIHLEEKVQEIRRDGKRYFVRTNNGQYDFDFVIAATPMPSLREFFSEHATGIEHSKVKVTTVKGKIKEKFDDGKTGYILVRDDGCNFDGISRYPDNIFNINSSSGENPELRDFFDDYDIVNIHDWHVALPRLSPNTNFPAPADKSGTFYLTGDFYLPCMEMSVQTGRKAARRIINRTA